MKKKGRPDLEKYLDGKGRRFCHWSVRLVVVLLMSSMKYNNNV